MNIVKKISLLVLLISTMQCMHGSIKQLGTIQEITEQEWNNATDDAYDLGGIVETTRPSYGKAAQADSITKIYDTLSGKTILTKTTQKVEGLNFVTTKQIKTSIATSAWTLQNAGLAIAGVGTALGLGAAAYYGFGKKSNSGTQSAEKSSVPTPISTPSTIQEQSTDVPPVLASVQSQESSAGQSEQPVARQPEQNNNTPAPDSGRDNQSVSSQEKQDDKKLVQGTKKRPVFRSSSLSGRIVEGACALASLGLGVGAAVIYFSEKNAKDASGSRHFEYQDIIEQNSDWIATLELLKKQSGQSVVGDYNARIAELERSIKCLEPNDNQGLKVLRQKLTVLNFYRDKLTSMIEKGEIDSGEPIVVPGIGSKVSKRKGPESKTARKIGVSRASSSKSLPKGFDTASLEQLFQTKLERIKAADLENSAQSSDLKSPAVNVPMSSQHSSEIKWVKNNNTGKWEEASGS